MNSLIANLGIVGPLISFLFFPLITSASQAPATNNQPRAGKEYRFVASSDSNKLEKEINESA